MKPMKLVTALTVATSLSGAAFAQVNLSAETASPTGVPGNTVLALGEVASSAGVANIQVATGQTLTNSIQNAAEGKTDISAAPFILPFLMSKGAGPYAKLGKEKGAELAGNLAVLYTYRLGTFALSSFESSSVKGWGDLEGKTIYNGPPRGGALTNARQIIKLTAGLEEGEGYTGVQVNWGQAVKTIQDGSADAHVLPTSFPDGRLNAASSAGKLTMYSMPKEVFESEAMQKYAKAPGSGAVEVPLDVAYQGDAIDIVSEDGMFRGVATIGGEVVRKDMDEALAYKLTKAFLDNLDLVFSKTPFLPNAAIGEVEDTNITGMCGANPLKYHAGAVRAWEEAGFTVPDCAK
ncbi:MAG: TAXI family TRAP transporter solute-binding subunit [Pseudomonadota bacterium]